MCGRPPSLAAGHFLLLAQEKVTKEKGTLAAAVAGGAGDCASALRRFADRPSMACSKRTRLLRVPLTGFFLRALAATERDPGNQKQSNTSVVPAKAGTQRLRSALAFGTLCDAAKGGRIRPRLRGRREGSRRF